MFLRQALSVTTDPVEEADLFELAGESASTAGHHNEAETLLRRAVELRRERGDRPATARATAALGRALVTPLRTEQAIAVLAPAADEFSDLGLDPGFVALLGQLARAHMLGEASEEAIAVADRALAAAERADLRALVADTLVTKGTALANLGRAYEGLTEIEGGLRLAERNGLAVTALRARLNLGAYMAEADRRAALDNDRVALAEARRQGQRRLALVLLGNAAEDAAWTADWDWALAQLEEPLAGELEPEDRVLLLGMNLRFHAWRGDPSDALLAEIERFAGDLSDIATLLLREVARADLALARGDLDDAAATYRRAAGLTAGNAPTALALAARAALLAREGRAAALDLEAFDATGIHGPSIEARRTSIRAGLAALDDRAAEALALYADAIRRFADLGVPVEQALTAIEMATLLDPSDPGVRAAAAAARDILVRVGARPFIARLDAALARSSMEAVASEAPADAPSWTHMTTG